jgi:hypothetical protein
MNIDEGMGPQEEMDSLRQQEGTARFTLTEQGAGDNCGRGKGKVKISLLQAMEAHRVARG